MISVVLSSLDPLAVAQSALLRSGPSTERGRKRAERCDRCAALGESRRAVLGWVSVLPGTLELDFEA